MPHLQNGWLQVCLCELCLMLLMRMRWCPDMIHSKKRWQVARSQMSGLVLIHLPMVWGWVGDFGVPWKCLWVWTSTWVSSSAVSVLHEFSSLELLKGNFAPFQLWGWGDENEQLSSWWTNHPSRSRWTHWSSDHCPFLLTDIPCLPDTSRLQFTLLARHPLVVPGIQWAFSKHWQGGVSEAALTHSV